MPSFDEPLALVLADYSDYWRTYFPEHVREREEVLVEINEIQDGSRSARPDTQMTPYQDRVAAVYGAYEEERYQLATLQHILTHVFRQLNEPLGHLISLGCGPASYELWLLKQRLVKRVTLVDHSPQMLARAREIAQQIGVADRVTTVCADASTPGLNAVSADVVFSINSMHWSANWCKWVAEATRVAKFGAPVFLTCTLMLPRSNIQPDTLSVCVREHLTVLGHGFVVEPQLVAGGQAALSMRFFVSGKKPTRFAAARAKNRR